MITSLKGRSISVEISPDKPTVIIGERINPTGRSRLAKALVEEKWEDLVRQDAIDQVAAGASVIDVNVGTFGVDEVALLPRAVKLVAEAVDVPLCLDSANPEALKAALKVCPGKALINSTTGEEKSMAVVLPVVKEYGAAVIALCHDEEGIGKTAEKRFSAALKIIARARELGINEADILFDPMVLSTGAERLGGVLGLQTAAMLSERLGVNMTLGASNVSFGLPDRHIINNAFLAMAISRGVNAPIINPLAPGIIEAMLAADLVLGKDPYAGRYIKNYRKYHPVNRGG